MSTALIGQIETATGQLVSGAKIDAWSSLALERAKLYADPGLTVKMPNPFFSFPDGSFLVYSDTPNVGFNAFKKEYGDLRVRANVVPPMSEPVNLLRFGADRTGVKSSSAAMQEALTYLASLNQGYGAQLYVPYGIYRFDVTPLLPSNLIHLTLKGDGAWASRFLGNGANTLLRANSNLAFLRCVDVGFANAVNGFSFNTSNIDVSNIIFYSCSFRTISGIAIECQDGSDSTSLLVDNCLYIDDATPGNAGVFVYAASDFATIRDSWLETNSVGPSVIYKPNTVNPNLMLIERVTGVPGAGAGATAVWLENHSSAKLVSNRFGSEDGVGRTMVHQAEVNQFTQLTVHDNLIVCTNDYTYKFDALPETVSIKRNWGYQAQGKGIWIASGASTLKGYIERGSWEIDDFDPPPNGYFTESNSPSKPLMELVYAKLSTTKPHELSTQILFADAMVSRDFQAVLIDLTNTNVTIGTGAYPLLGGLTAKKLTCTANPGLYVGYEANLIAPLPQNSGVFTAVVDLYVTGATRPFWFEMVFCSNYKRQMLYNGLNIIQFGFQRDGFDNVNEFFIKDMPNGAVVLMGRMRIFLGAKHIPTVETVYSDLSTGTIPNTAYIYHNKGDRILWADTVSGGFMGQVCTTAGQPGTFKNYGAIA